MKHTHGTDRSPRATRFAIVLCLAIAIVAIPAVALAAPVTSSNAVTSYNNSAVISITATTGVGNPAYVATRYFFDASAPATITAWPATATVSISTVGSHSLTYWSIDASGVVEAQQVKNFTILDTIKPTTFTDAVVAYLNTAPIHLFASDSAGGSGVATTYHTIDGGANSTSTSFTVVGFGSHTMKFWSVDVAGNSETTQSAAFFIDDTAPPVTTSDAVASYNGDAHILLSATDINGSGVATTFYNLDGAGYVAGTSIDVDAPGSHTLLFYSIDNQGNIESPANSVTFAVTADSTPPVTTGNTLATYATSPALIHLSAVDNTGGSGVASLNYKVDGGPTQTITNEPIRAQLASFPKLGFPVGHPGGTSPTTCACHPGIVYSGHGGGPSPTNCTVCHDYASPAAAINLPSDHTTRLTGCKSCHPSIAPAIMPSTTQNPNHFGQSVGFPGGGACESCHTFTVTSPPVEVGIETTVSVAGVGAHTIEYWAVDEQGNIETHHVVPFTIGGGSVTITRSTASVVLPRPFILSGVKTPGVIGDPVVVYVKKPGSPRFSYSSARLCYATSGGGALWWYRYTPLLRGTYTFFAQAGTVRSGNVSVSVR